jgi:hypothetical protein
MKFLLLRSLAAAALATLLAACGGADPQTDTTVIQTAAVMQAVAVTGPQGASQAAVQGTPPVYGPNQPEPDCAAEGCNGLRIIDANAEAYRMDAMKRAEQDGAQPGV